MLLCKLPNLIDVGVHTIVHWRKPNFVIKLRLYIFNIEFMYENWIFVHYDKIYIYI